MISHEPGIMKFEEANKLTSVTKESTCKYENHVLTTHEKENKNNDDGVLLKPNIGEDNSLELIKQTEKATDYKASGSVLKDLQDDDSLQHNKSSESERNREGREGG